jgi:RNA polymerase sigma factor (sigma-70 family)
VMEAAGRLRPQEQEILRLSLWEHLSHDDIGTVLGIEPNAAKQRLHRARKALDREHTRLTRTQRFRITPAANEGGE